MGCLEILFHMKLPTFKDKKLFTQAFTHRSYLNEAKEKLESNERLEFLGDSVISFIVSQKLYIQYPEFDEGTLTNLRSLLVNTKSLASQAQELGFGKLLRLSKGEEESKGRENPSLLADCFEAFVGALYLDRGATEVSDFLTDTILKKAEDYVAKKAFKDPKSLLQEYVQAQKLPSPSYKVIKEEGPPHDRDFTVGVYVSEKLIAEGLGKSKQKAEEMAASLALENLKR